MELDDPTSSHDPGTIDVLAVDDDARNLLALQAVLADLPLNLVSVRSGREALRWLVEHDASLILLDVHMPDLDGFETAQIIRSRERSRATPIIFLTANDDVKRMATGYAHGAVDYLFKPIVPEILRAKVKVFAELQRSREELIRQRLSEQQLRHEAELLRTRLEQQQSFAAALTESLEAARRALAARDEFLQMASHQLRTPLASMQMTVDNALRALEGPPARERIARALHLIDEQTGHLTRLVTELLSFVVIEAGRLRFARSDVDLAAVVDRAARSLSPMLTAAGCDVQMSGDTRCDIQGDSFWIEQAVGNVLANAAKYGARKPVEVRVFSEGDRARIEIRDEGIGIAPEDHERIFLPFQRAVSPEHFGGLGIGLCVVKRVVEGHGGRVAVHSSPGTGATFVLELPR